jgi:DNA anti-recombination protein RmuC
VLKKTQDKLNQASSDLDDLVGTRTRQIQRKLQNVQDLPLLVDDEEAKKKPPSLEEGF